MEGDAEIFSDTSAPNAKPNAEYHNAGQMLRCKVAEKGKLMHARAESERFDLIRTAKCRTNNSFFATKSRYAQKTNA